MLTPEQKDNLKKLVKVAVSTAYINGLIDEREFSSLKQIKIAHERSEKAMQDLINTIEEL